MTRLYLHLSSEPRDILLVTIVCKGDGKGAAVDISDHLQKRSDLFRAVQEVTEGEERGEIRRFTYSHSGECVDEMTLPATNNQDALRVALQPPLVALWGRSFCRQSSPESRYRGRQLALVLFEKYVGIGAAL